MVKRPVNLLALILFLFLTKSVLTIKFLLITKSFFSTKLQLSSNIFIYLIKSYKIITYTSVL